MTMMDVRPADLTELTDQELALAYCDDGADVAALQAEEDRREQAAHRASSARNARWIREGDWYGFAHAQFLQAEAECEGYLVNNRGRYRRNEHGQPDPVDAWSLWNGSQWAVDAWASFELRRFWERNPRITRAEWARQEARARREEISDQLDKDERDAVRCDSGADEESAGDRGDGRRNAFPGPDARAENAEADPGTRADGRGSSPVQPVIVLTEENPVTVIPGPDPVEAARDRLAQRAAELAAERAQRPVAVPAMSVPAPEAVSPAAVAVRPPDAVVTTRRRAQIDGADTLNYARMFLGRFALWPSEATLDLVTLWCAHAHARDAEGMLVWQASPRLLFQSAEPGAGKSHAMTLAARLCPLPEILVEPSEPAVAQLVGREHATLFFDEADVLFGRGQRKAAVRAVINTGYTRDGTWCRVRQGAVDRIPTFGALALAGLDTLETSTDGNLAALLSRCIRVRMRRGPEGYAPPRWDKEARTVATLLGERLAAWTSQELDELADAEPDMPECVGNRQAQLWEPLTAVADQAGGRWPEAARTACEELTLAGTLPEEDDDSASELDRILASWNTGTEN